MTLPIATISADSEMKEIFHVYVHYIINLNHQDEYIATQAEETDPDVIVTVQANDDDDTLENSRITYVIEGT